MSNARTPQEHDSEHGGDDDDGDDGRGGAGGDHGFVGGDNGDDGVKTRSRMMTFIWRKKIMLLQIRKTWKSSEIRLIRHMSLICFDP